MNNATQDHYFTLDENPVNSELKIKGSRFISFAGYVSSKESAGEKISEIRKKYHDATHNCFAYRISETECRFSDDGEPSGTAGKPILNVLENKNLIQSLIIITRYFGGVKLGTGGLIRAYSDAAKTVIEKAHIIQKVHTRTIMLRTDYQHLQDLFHIISQFAGEVENPQFGQNIQLNARIPSSRFAGFQNEITTLIKKGFPIII